MQNVPLKTIDCFAGGRLELSSDRTGLVRDQNNLVSTSRWRPLCALSRSWLIGSTIPKTLSYMFALRLITLSGVHVHVHVLCKTTKQYCSVVHELDLSLSIGFGLLAGIYRVKACE